MTDTLPVTSPIRQPESIKPQTYTYQSNSHPEIDSERPTSKEDENIDRLHTPLSICRACGSTVMSTHKRRKDTAPTDKMDRFNEERWPRPWRHPPLSLRHIPKKGYSLYNPLVTGIPSWEMDKERWTSETQEKFQDPKKTKFKMIMSNTWRYD